MKPTSEQAKAVELFGTGDSLVVEAGAGSGKTSTLILMAESQPNKTGTYVAFNKAIVATAKARMPGNVNAKTIHSLAWWPTIGNDAAFKRRLHSATRVHSERLAAWMGMDAFSIKVATEFKRISSGYLASLAMKAIKRFCNSADRVPSAFHVPYITGIDLQEAGKERSYANNNAISKHVEPLLGDIWEDLCTPDGRLPYEFDHYLKVWELHSPRIKGDFILFDEGQDATGVMRSIVEQQKTHGTQVVYVGDSNQAIYTWKTAVDALKLAKVDHRTQLSHSFRFGKDIADAANSILALIPDSNLRLVGSENVDSYIDKVTCPDAVLCRTNAMTVSAVMEQQSQGRNPCLLGGATHMIKFAEAAIELQVKGKTKHPELACFTSWEEVQEYVNCDPTGDDLAMSVRLVDDKGPYQVISTLQTMPSEKKADVIISTVHKAKGKEWDRVQIGKDFGYPRSMGKEPKLAELPASYARLLYVAVTRAKITLDVTKSHVLCDILGLTTPEVEED